MTFSTHIKNLLRYRLIVLTILLLPLTGCSVFEDLINSDGTVNLSGKLMQATGVRPYRDRSRGDRKLTSEEAKRAAQAKELFNNASKISVASPQRSSGGRNTIVVPPGKKVKLTVRGFCLDMGIPAPRSNEPFQLIKVSQLVDPGILPVYKALQAWEAKHPDRHSAVQSLMWGIRHARSKSPLIRELRPFQKEILDAALPGGSKRYERYLTKQYNKGLMDDLKRQALGQVSQFVDNAVPVKLKSNLNLSSVEGLKSSAAKLLKKPAVQVANKKISPEEVLIASGVAAVMSQLTNMPVSGSPQTNTAYTLLEEGVAAYSYSPGGVEKAYVELVNTTDRPYSFDATDYAGFSTRSTQPVAMYPDVSALPEAPQDPPKDCENVTILSVTPKKCCYKMGETISPDDFDVRTSPPGVRISVDRTEATISLPIYNTAVSTENITVTATCSNGNTASRSVSVKVVDENHETATASLTVGEFLSKVEKLLNGLSGIIPDGKNYLSLKFDYDAKVAQKYLCCNSGPGICEIKPVKKMSSNFSCTVKLETDDIPMPGLPVIGFIVIGAEGKLSANFVNQNPTCEKPQVCGEVNLELAAKIGGGIKTPGIDLASVSVVGKGTIRPNGKLQYCFSEGFSGFTGGVCVKIEVIVSGKFMNLFSGGFNFPLLREQCR